MTGNKRGNRGESLAAAFLESKGYKILEKNYHSRYGEIDIIAEKDGYTVFAEVKLRREDAMVSGQEAVTLQKQKKILYTSAVYMEKNGECAHPRYDVVVLTETAEGKIKVRHIKSAFGADGILE